ncbi:hypothetical protein LLH06_13200 [Mucilaginibacter daejeonensis]|uniref:hypothetical protein n=1 Tax=Mucilaginibacter daejeonensis TaxID=398049 RepID=UPI001D17AE55|nr:hypothetical protein [Mucilaginibacter daejeonensis]UEG51918.1 hypothetical protein LLH06_13200 [Mucilaginibacter daejeonensis]
MTSTQKLRYIDAALIALILMMTITSCHQDRSESTANNGTKRTVDSGKTTKSTPSKMGIKLPSSFVVSCGSGCAMTYTPTRVTGALPNITVSFKVDMFMNDQLSDTYTEVYVFAYDPSDHIRTIHLQGKEESVLTTSPPSAQRSFAQFAAELISNDIDKGSVASSKMIYDRRTDPSKAFYTTMPTASVKGLDKYSCNEAETRYLSLPSPVSVRLILVPQDCGDMSYRYYLIAIKNGQVTGNLYVEGEWYEPDGEDDKETRHFAITDNFQIIVTITIAERSVEERYHVEEDGTIVKEKGK